MKLNQYCISENMNNLITNLKSDFSNAGGNKRPIDDPLLHQGRKRSIPHERGNWPSFVYIPLQLDHDEDIMINLQEILQYFCEKHSIMLNLSTEFHVSLSRTHMFYLHWIQPISQQMKEMLSIESRFVMSLKDIQVFCNDELTRTFLSITVSSTSNALNKIVKKLDDCLSSYNLQKFYEDANFHVTIAWINGNHKEAIKKILPHLRTVFEKFMASNEEINSFEVEAVFLKTGNRVHKFTLI